MADDEERGAGAAGEPAPDGVTVARRADGRPPEEEGSEDPEGQARAILRESEERLEGGAAPSEPGPGPA